MLPNFVCPGAARSATTALYYLLIQHPQIFLPALKETRFFTQDYEKGLKWYEETYYANVQNEPAIGDISPVYLVDERCPKRLHDALGADTRIIFMLRDPVERAYSHYSMLRNHHFEDLPFAEAVARSEDARITKSLERYEHKYGFQYVKESTYSEAIARYLDYFSADRIKYVLFEEFTADTSAQLTGIVDFLGLPQGFDFALDVYLNRSGGSSSSRLNKVFYNNALAKKARDLIQMNTGWKTQSMLKKVKTTLLKGKDSEAPRLDLEIRTKLYADFEEEIVRLEALLDRELSVWRQPAAALSESN